MDYLDASKTQSVKLKFNREKELVSNLFQVLESIGNGLENQFQSPMKRDAHY